VSRAKEGTAVRNAIADESVFEICELVCGGLRTRLEELAGILDGVGVGDSTARSTTEARA
jgi:hypothetical protein